MELFRTPDDLVSALRDKKPKARQYLHEFLGEPLRRLMGDLVTKHGLDADSNLLVVHALHAAEVALRLDHGDRFPNRSWAAFRASLLMHIAKVAMEPHGHPGGNGHHGPTALPDSPGYQSAIFYRPLGRIGSHLFGGDWYAGHRLKDGTLWVFLADVTGHGYYAYLLATALPTVWQRLWAIHPGEAPEPAELLAAMHEMLSDCLPDGIFLECTLVRLTEDGQATISPAGGTRLLVHTARRHPDLLKLRGAWIGLRPPVKEEQYALNLEQGDEMVLATDGVFDQLDEQGGAERISRDAYQRNSALFDALRDAIEHSMAGGDQKDDITMVLLRRTQQVPEEVIVPMANPLGTGDVPV